MKKKTVISKIAAGLLIFVTALLLIAAGGRDSGAADATGNTAANVNPP